VGLLAGFADGCAAGLIGMRKELDMKYLVACLFVLGVVFIPGCIVQDIHDQIALSNEKLTQIDESFAKVERANELLEQLEKQLDSTLGPIDENMSKIRERLASIDAKLEAMDTNMVSMDERMVAVNADLQAVSAHLASLRKTINNLDSTIPFLKFSGDDEEAKAGLEGGGEPKADPAVEPVGEEK